MASFNPGKENLFCQVTHNVAFATVAATAGHEKVFKE